MKKRRILFLIHALNPAGAQKVLIRMVNAMDSERYDITIKTIYNRHELKNELNKSVKLSCIIPFKNTLLIRFCGFLIRRVLPPQLIADYLLGRNYDYEVAYLEGETTKLLSGSSLPINRKIAWVHTNLMSIFTSQKLYRTLEQHKKVYEKFGSIVCVSQGVKDSVHKRFGFEDNLKVIYNIIDHRHIELLSNSYSNFSPQENLLNIIMVGNCRKEKSYDRLLRVCFRLKKEQCRFHVTICGNGSEYDNLLQLRNELSLEDTVDFIGEVENPYPYMKNADVLVCSSIDEGFSTVIVESIIVGCPVLTTDCSGMKEILDNGKYGIIVENSEDSLYCGIKDIIDNPQKLNYYKALIPERKAFFSAKESLYLIDELFS